MAATTANDLIERAMSKARIIHPGEDIPADKATQALAELNDFLESWALEKLMVIADVLESFTLGIGAATRTYGVGGDFDSDRPVEIKDECFVRSGGVDYPCRLKTLNVYRRIATKSTTGRPEIIAYNPEYPLVKVYLYPTPDAADDIYLRVAKDITSFALLTTSADLMPGYRRAIVANFAMELCASYGKKISKELAYAATESKKVIKAANSVQVKSMTTPHLTILSGNYYSGDITNPF